MPNLAPIRTALLLTALSAAALAQPPQAVSQAESPASRPPQPVTISYIRGQLSFSADNASLNQILRQISQQTGMKITGGISDQRVYGSYGPAEPVAVLSQLLDGTGYNILLVQPHGAGPTQLVLMPRNGNPTPPDPNAARQSALDNRGPIGPPQSQPNRPFPIRNGLPPNRQPPGATINAPGTSQPGTTTTQQSPNGVRTPQQINDELQQLNQPNRP